MKKATKNGKKAKKVSEPRSEAGYRVVLCSVCQTKFLPSGVGSFGSRITNDDGTKTWAYKCGPCREKAAQEKAELKKESLKEKAARIGSKKGDLSVKLESTKALEKALGVHKSPEPVQDPDMCLSSVQ